MRRAAIQLCVVPTNSVWLWNAHKTVCKLVPWCWSICLYQTEDWLDRFLWTLAIDYACICMDSPNFIIFITQCILYLLEFFVQHLAWWASYGFSLLLEYSRYFYVQYVSYASKRKSICNICMLVCMDIIKCCIIVVLSSRNLNWLSKNAIKTTKLDASWNLQ